MDFQLKNRVALVTGGSGDIGAAIAATFAREGAKVAVGWQSRPERADEVGSRLSTASLSTSPAP